jgi:hypothetical protein
MGLLDRAKALVKEGEQAVDKIGNVARKATKNAVKEVVQDGRKGAGAVADELRKARGIISGDVDGFVRPYAERLLTDAETDLARQVFGESLPYGAIYLSNGLGLGQRPYTIPHPLHLGSYVIHIGPQIFPDATDSSTVVLGHTGDAVFIHESTHVWQGVNRRHSFDYILDSVYNQFRFGSHAYDLDQDEVGRKSWGKFNAEQQAMIVEHWYVGGMSQSDDAFVYIKDNIRARTP